MNIVDKISRICVSLLLVLLPLSAFASTESKEEGVDVKGIVLGHLSDAYDWHITTYNGHHYSIPLPIIIKGETSGWHVFSSSRLAHGETYNNFYIDAERNGKIYEKLSDGTVVRPLDISLTKNVVQIFSVSTIMLVIFMTTERWYSRR